jgi:oligopeptide/dipeptide ABC transporter ATP-binding protein
MVLTEAKQPTLLAVSELCIDVRSRSGTIRAVDGVSLRIDRGETLGLVGESGSGKSMFSLGIMRVLPRSARIVSGSVHFDGEDLLARSERSMRKLRGVRMSMVLQQPLTSLNPGLTIGKQVAQPIRLHQGLRGAALRAACIEILTRVRIPDAERRLRSYPHQLSGGMQQRVVGAMALSCHPDLLIADEPTTALDPTVRNQYLSLLRELQEEFGFALLFISHDLGVISRMCDRVAVMYAGRVVEEGPTRTVLDSPSHPYTVALLGAIPTLGMRGRPLTAIAGQAPTGPRVDPGCPFAPRCASRMPCCTSHAPSRMHLSEDHAVECWLHSAQPVSALEVSGD